MDNKPSIDRDLLIPILVGGISVVGILMIFLVGRFSASRASVPDKQTETPFKYIFLGTEPGIVTGSAEVQEPELLTNVPPDSLTPGPTNATQAFVTPTLAASNNTTSTGFPSNNNNRPTISVTSPANTSVPTSTSASGPPLNPGTYDDVDSHLVYDGSGWVAQQVETAYKGTLHVSQEPGSSVTFKFIGIELRVGYQVASSLGTITIRIDGSSYGPVDQSDTSAAVNEWISPNPLSPSSHTVTITHASGGSVNLDYVIIPEVANTATPTSTP